MLKASDFKNKEVINLANSEKLGYINDFEICTSAGEISAIYVPEKQTSFLNLKTKYIRIPWNKIQGIGANFEPKNFDRSVCDEIVGASDEDAFRYARLIAKEQGVLVGISSGAALSVAVKLAKLEENKAPIKVKEVKKEEGGAFAKMKAFVRKAVDCCIE